MKNLKKTVIFSLCLLVYCSAFAEKVDRNTAQTIAENKIAICKKTGQVAIKNITEIGDNSFILFYLAELSPKGYILIPADDRLMPVIAYSFENDADVNSSITEFFKHDIQTRLAAADQLTQKKLSERKTAWEKLLSLNFTRDSLFEQWPPEGTTTTGGWLETNWNQTAPWNGMCPIDPITSIRSYTGCPATAMAMILNFHKTTNNTQFDDSDDYYHTYAGRNFYIDDDFAQHGFPSFADLNLYLDTVNLHWQENSGKLSNQDMAALNFACGVAATQVFTSAGSGTFAVSQAFDAYQRFGCYDAVLYTESDEELFPTLISNMQNALPAHLAIVDENWESGHNVVVDGYNTDNYFHVNFGYSGSYNGWYQIPDELLFGMTVIEGVIVDIMKSHVNIPHENLSGDGIEIFPNPAKDVINIRSNEQTCTAAKLFDVSGKQVAEIGLYKQEGKLNIGQLSEGIYLLQILNGNQVIKNQKVVILK